MFTPVILILLSTLRGKLTAGTTNFPDNLQLEHEITSRLRNSSLDDALRKILEQFRETMESPNPYLGNITLEPFTKEYEDIDFHIPIATTYNFWMKGHFKNVSVKGLSNYEVECVQTNILHMTVNVHFKLPSTEVEGYYYFDGGLDDLVHIYGEGPFSAHFKTAAVTAHLKLDVVAPRKLNIRSCTFVFTLENLQADMEGLFGGGELSQVISATLSAMGKEVINERRRGARILSCRSSFTCQ
ncbi:uncharacterized protein [Anabrus simplex]|uniref:uncharacterized protein isoform X2 n=1 Tax=Anabrus simplex TaxID=316456 RepID=UPI0034DD2B7A